MASCPRCGNTHNDIDAKVCKVCGSPMPAAGSRTTARLSSNWRDTSTWKRHQLFRLGASPIELKVGERFVFGRASDSDLPIQSPKISRHHAVIEWEDDEPLLRDLDSQNGTEVNEKPIRRHKLENGDELQLGPFSCTYRCLSGRGSLQQAQSLEDSQADTQTLMAVAMSGELGEMSIYELLETLGYHEHTGTLEVYSPQDQEGRVTVQQGRATHAEVGKLRGDRAILELLSWTDGRYRFVTGFDPELQDNVRGTIQHLLTRYRSTLAPERRQRAAPPPKPPGPPPPKPGGPPPGPAGRRPAPPPGPAGRRPAGPPPGTPGRRPPSGRGGPPAGGRGPD